MPAKNKSTKKVESAPEEQSSDEQMYSGCGSGFGMNFKDAMSKETKMHVLRGISELALAMDSMIPKSKIPEEAKQHAQVAKREMLLMLRSLIDAKLNCVTPETEKKQKLKKIEVE